MGNAETEAVERKLLVVRERLNASLSTAPSGIVTILPDFGPARAAMLLVERELAQAKGEEYAAPFNFPVQWDIGAPLPVLIANDYKTFLIFYVRFVDPNWDGTYMTLRESANPTSEPMALVEFEGCTSAKLGAPNEEVFSGHPLYGKGLEGYTVQIVHNSRWAAELERVNQVHSLYNADRWRDAKHFVFWFHDSTFECVADSYQVEVLQKPLAEILAIAYERMI